MKSNYPSRFRNTTRAGLKTQFHEKRCVCVTDDLPFLKCLAADLKRATTSQIKVATNLSTEQSNRLLQSVLPRHTHSRVKRDILIGNGGTPCIFRLPVPGWQSFKNRAFLVVTLTIKIILFLCLGDHSNTYNSF